MNGDIITIRLETGNDFGEISEVVRLAFRDMPESDHTEHLLVTRLRQSEAYVPDLSLVAEDSNGKIVGHIMLSEVKVISGDGSRTLLSVAPLSVLPGYQRQGIGGMLVREAHARASKAGYTGSVLLGHKDYYPRFGYRRASAYGISFPFDAPDECCMAAELTVGRLDGIHGVVKYPDAFLLE